MADLLWVSHTMWGIGHERFLAPTVEGIYVIHPMRDRVKRKWTFLGYDVRYVTRRRYEDEDSGDNPDLAETEDIRVIKTGVQSYEEAKAIAQADFQRG